MISRMGILYFFTAFSLLFAVIPGVYHILYGNYLGGGACFAIALASFRVLRFLTKLPFRIAPTWISFRDNTPNRGLMYTGTTVMCVFMMAMTFIGTWAFTHAVFVVENSQLPWIIFQVILWYVIFATSPPSDVILACSYWLFGYRLYELRGYYILSLKTQEQLLAEMNAYGDRAGGVVVVRLTENLFIEERVY